MNIYSRFETAFRRARDAAALICPGGEDWTHARLIAEVDRAAAALDAWGVGVGDRVLVQTEKTPAAVALYLACVKSGAVYVPINTAYTHPEVEYFIADCQPALYVVGDRFDADVPVAVLDDGGSGTFLRGAATVPVPTVDRADDDLAAIIYTSGTTGRSKGAMLTHANLISNAETLCAAWDWRADDVLLHALPIFHVHGLFVALHCAFLNATPVVLLPRFEVSALLRELSGATVLMGVPTFYTRLLEDASFDADSCANMRLFISGSAPLAEQTFAAFEQRTGFRILERYGMSETLMNTSNPLAGERVAGTVGFALPGIAVRVADDGGKELPPGEVGNIELKGPNVFKGYWRQPERTAAEFRDDGFFVTGDMGTMDGEGRLTIVGRTKDVVITGGYNVYPKEVEALLDEMPGVDESAVIGIAHSDFGEAVVAVVVARGCPVNQADVDSYLKGKLARYKQPKRVVCLGDLPRNAMGKVQKNVLRATYAHLFRG
ncbi:MAG: AMP-binding protein [Gammaproteobacteria bacterium]|nr:AMP-binding protein [Gammaproteobacteria bacterium]